MNIDNECEAAIAIFVAVIDVDGELSEFEIEKISNTMAYCRRFQSYDLTHVLRKVFSMKPGYSTAGLIQTSVPFIEKDFAATFFAMLCDVLCSDGHTSETDIQLLALVATELGLPENEYLPIAKSFMVRYAWSINVA